MKQVLLNLKDRKTEVVDVPAPQVRDGSILIRTAISLVSAGTERNLVEFAGKSLASKAQSRPDLVRQVLNKARREGFLTTFESAMNRLDQPLAPGYSSAGTIISVGQDVADFKIGDRVVCAGGGFAVHAEVARVPKNLAAKLPKNVDFESGAFATLGAIALNGIRLASPQLGEKSAVIGLGLMGLITAILLQAAGCEVYGFDIDPNRLKFAQKIGVGGALNKDALSRYQSMTRGRGFDHVLICADTAGNDTVRLAADIARDRGRVVSIGVVGLDLPRKPYYEKELGFRVSRSSGPGRYDAAYEERGQDYPVGYVRWTEGRNLEAFVDLLAQGKISMGELITHRFDITQAGQAYDLITGKTDESYLGVLLAYPEADLPLAETIQLRGGASLSPTSASSVRLGILGAGNYAGATFLPAIRKSPLTRLVGIASSGGAHAQNLGRKFGFDFATSSTSEILDHPEINTVAILTRHNSHARLTLEALKKGTNVYCEKPLAIEKSGLKAIERELAKEKHPCFTVGFNRRFAPFSIALHEFFDSRTEPLYAHYRINAGYLPASHWLNNPQEGGGRLVGEACHFIDYLIFLSGQTVNQVSVSSLPDSGKYSQDNLDITIEFQDGSIGHIAYLANGSQRVSKEYLEVFCEGKVGIVDDFRKLTLVDESGTRTLRSRLRQDKGHRATWQAFANAIVKRQAEPIPYSQLMQASFAALACQHSLLTGQPVVLSEFIHSK